jgi:hypothetical protein
MRRRFIYLSGLLLLAAGCSASSETADQNTVNETAAKAPVAMGIPKGPAGGPAIPITDRPDDIDLTLPGAVSRGRVVPTLIDTRTFQPQIQNAEPWTGPRENISIHRPKKEGLGGLPAGPPNDLVPGQLTNLSRVNPGPSFPGISMSPWTPPDPSIAVGPNHVVETTNMELAFFNKNGTRTFQQRLDSSGNPGFFETIGAGNFTFDPKCFYDHYSNRFIVLALEVYSGSEQAWITFAVSDDDDPNGIWYKYRTWAVVSVGSSTFWVDYPGLGFDQEGFYVTGNLFGLNNGGFGGVLFRAFDKTPILNGQAVDFNDLRDGNAASVQVAQTFSDMSGNNPAPLFVSQESNSQLRLQAINNPLGNNPSLATTLVSVPSGSSPPNAPNIGGSLGTVDGRLMNVHLRGNRLWTCNTVNFNNRAVARWYEINVGNWPNGGVPTLAQSGNIDLGSGNHTFFPAIYTDPGDNAAMVIGKSRSNEFASVMATGRLNSDPAGTMGTPQQLAIGNSGANGRWGDYFDIALDPVNNSIFWMVGQYQTGSGWQTTIHSFSLVTTVTVDADSFNVIRGLPSAGNLSDTSASDNSYLQVNPGQVLKASEPPVWLEFVTTLPSDSPNALEFLLEAKTSTFGLRQEIALFNYDNGSYDIVSEGPATTTDSVISIDLGGDALRYVQPGTGEAKARVSWKSRGQTSAFPWTVSIDQLVWTSTQ